MATKIYNKLVRDMIPVMIKNDGKKCTYHFALGDHKKLLKDKLLEECNELIEAKTPDDIREEIADIITVLSGIMVEYGLDPHIVFAYAGFKNSIKGDFSSFVVLESVEEEEDEN